jgi:hypothetical protein
MYDVGKSGCQFVFSPLEIPFQVLKVLAEGLLLFLMQNDLLLWQRVRSRMHRNTQCLVNCKELLIFSL